MKKNSFFLHIIILFIIITGFSYKAISQGQGQTPIHFKMGGNSSTNTSERLGLKTNSELHLITADTSRMEVTKEGDVKIKKEVFLEKYLGQQNERRLIEITPGGKIQPLAGGSTALRKLIYEPLDQIPGPGQPPCPDFPFWAAKNNIMYLESCSANVGIGTDNPTERLDVRGNILGWNIRGERITGDWGYFLNRVGVGTTSPQVNLDVQSNALTQARVLANGAFDARVWVANGYFGYALGIDAQGKGHIYRNSNTPTPTMTFSNDGNVGIGDTDPQKALSVCGVIKASEFLIESTWCDFVFKPDYKLMTIKQKQDFINENGHLPNIQSEKEVTENGALLGKAVTGILQNTEEQMLYLIQLNEKLELLAKENEELKTRIKLLEEK